MNVTAHQEKEKNEETKTGKKKAREERKQAIDFKKAVCCPSAIVQGAARQHTAFLKSIACFLKSIILQFFNITFHLAFNQLITFFLHH